MLASTATTVAVFLPIIFIQEEAGQLFRDIAIAITFSILLSMLVSAPPCTPPQLGCKLRSSKRMPWVAPV